MPPTDLLPAAEAARMLGVDRSTLNRWASAGTIRAAVKAPGIRGPRMYRRSEVERLARRRQKAAA